MGPYLLQFNLMGVHPGHTAKSLLFLKTQGKSENFLQEKSFLLFFICRNCLLFAWNLHFVNLGGIAAEDKGTI